jgi:hypothetical protein
LLELSGEEGMNGRPDFTYVLALAAARGLEGDAKAEEHYRKAIEANPKLITWNILISNLRRFLLYVITGIIAIYLAYRLLGLVLEANTIK